MLAVSAAHANSDEARAIEQARQSFVLVRSPLVEQDLHGRSVEMARSDCRTFLCRKLGPPSFKQV